MERTRDSQLLAWSAPQCPFAIEYSPKVLDDIRLAVVDAFFSLPRGGVEIGGILLGDFEDQRLRITGYAPVECEHAFGPSFTLSERDRTRLAELLGRPSLSGRQVVGWYHSHSRGEVPFSDADREIHQRFFPETWQTALVLKPHTFQPTRADFFFREEGGSIPAETSHGEFALEPLPPRPPQAAPVAAAAAPAPPLQAPANPVSVEPPPPAARRKRPRRGRRFLLAAGACLAAVLLAYGAGYILDLRANLKVQTQRAERAERALADAHSQLKTEREKSAAQPAAGK